MEKVAILGASRGLGAELAVRAVTYSESVFLMARKIDLLQSLADGFKSEFPDRQVLVDSADFSKEAGRDFALNALREYAPTKIFYVAGGGPYGLFKDKDWKDHKWSFDVSFVFAAQTLHMALQELVPRGLNQFVYVGSAIAEGRPDPSASSYAASKHGLFGLVKSVQVEMPYFDLRLFSPGYMDTDLLPMNAWPRQVGEPLIDPVIAAEELWSWSVDDRYRGDHYIFTTT
jgi:short-subunit dehydrogenase